MCLLSSQIFKEVQMNAFLSTSQGIFISVVNSYAMQQVLFKTPSKLIFGGALQGYACLKK